MNKLSLGLHSKEKNKYKYFSPTCLLINSLFMEEGVMCNVHSLCNETLGDHEHFYLHDSSIQTLFLFIICFILNKVFLV